MEVITKEQIESLKKRAQDVNTRIVSVTTKKEMAQKRVTELLNELGIDSTGLSSEDILNKINELEQKETDKVNKFKESIEAAEKILNAQENEVLN